MGPVENWNKSPKPAAGASLPLEGPAAPAAAPAGAPSPFWLFGQASSAAASCGAAAMFEELEQRAHLEKISEHAALCTTLKLKFEPIHKSDTKSEHSRPISINDKLV